MLGAATTVLLKAQSLGKRSGELQLATKRDIGDILQLYYEEGWVDYARADFDFLFDTSEHSCFKLVLDGKLIGVSFATMAGAGICYPHSNLISSSYRDKVNYFDEAIKYSDYLNQIADLHILYASKRVVRLYQSGGGFTPLHEYRRAVIDTTGPGYGRNSARPSTQSDFPAILALNKDVYKADRAHLIRHFTDTTSAKTFILPGSAGRIDAYAMVRELPKYRALGPVLAENEDAAAEVIAAAVRAYSPAPLVIEGRYTKLKKLLDGRFAHHWEENTMTKMYKGDSSLLENEDKLFSIFSRYIS